VAPSQTLAVAFNPPPLPSFFPLWLVVHPHERPEHSALKIGTQQGAYENHQDLHAWWASYGMLQLPAQRHITVPGGQPIHCTRKVIAKLNKAVLH